MAQRTHSFAGKSGRKPGRSHLLGSGSAIAGAIALVSIMSSVAVAQTIPTVAPRENGTRAVQATGTFAVGSGTIATSPARDVVTVTTDETIINWTTLDTLSLDSTNDYVNFLPNGTEVLYVGGASGYTVLNRVFSAPDVSGQFRGIAFDGTVTSRVGSPTGAVGGNIWFYSPGGILASAGSLFNVGSLVLTTSDINAISAGGSQIDFQGVTQSDSSVIVQAGAAINANQNGSYVALLAPRVEQAGTVTVDGSAAYVGAEEAQLMINNGLFDITIGVGSDDANGVVHTGTTTGAASQATLNNSGGIADADARAIYMVAVAKNDAINMLVGGDIGYAAAARASRTDNGTIILSAGAGVSATGGPSSPTITVDSENAVEGGSVEFTGGSFTSDVTASASEDITVFPEFGEAITIGSDGRGAYELSLSAEESIIFGAGVGGVISTEGDVTLRAGLDQAQGGDIDLQIAGNLPGPGDPVFNNGQVSIGGNLRLDASARGRDDFFIIRNNGNTGIGEDASAGNINVSISNGASLNIDSSLILDTSAQGGKGEVSSGDSTAGSTQLTVSGGTLDVNGSIIVGASAISAGTGTIGGNGPAAIGADGVAGDVTIDLSGGVVTAGSLSIQASGAGTTGSDENAEQDNQGSAGSVAINVTGGSHTFGSVGITANSSGGTSYDDAGNRIRGSIRQGSVDIAVSGTDSTLTVNGDLSLEATSSGAFIDPAGTAVSLSARNTGTSGGLFVGDDIFVSTRASNGAEGTVTTSGAVSVLADGSTISINDLLSIETEANGQFSDGRDFQGGDITLLATGAGSIVTDDIRMDASATGSLGDGGTGTGGTITVTADNGTIQSSSVFRATAAGQGGSGIGSDDRTDVGIGQGGSVIFTVRGAGGSMDFGSVTANTDGSIFSDEEGGFGFDAGDGGRGLAGDVTFNIEAGTFVAQSVTVSADGFGGQGGDVSDLDDDPLLGAPRLGVLSVSPAAAMVGAPGMGSGGRGGDGVGGDVEFNLTGGTATVVDLDVTANGIGGDGAFGDIDSGTLAGDGGDAVGGTATFNAISGSLTVTNELNVAAQGNTEFGRGNGGFGNGVQGGIGGNATGGDAIFNMTGTATINADVVNISADAFGGRGGTGDSYFDSGIGAPVNGEDGGAAGSGTAGNAVFNNTSGDISFTTLTVSANGEGGRGGESRGFNTGEAENDGGVGGAGIGGVATINLNQDDASDPTYIVQATGSGGSGGDGLDSGNGGLAQGGTARINVNDVAVNLTTATIDASATGGAGSFSAGDGGDGGDGGEAIAGSAILDVNGAGAVLTSDSPLTLIANAVGGAGGIGSTLNTGATGATAGGDGGAGGNATAGLVQVIARDGATATFSSNGNVTANATGGAGGGGGADFFTFGNFGSGGDAGSATGGTLEVLADTGATLNLLSDTGTTVLSADATGAEGGDGGSLTFGLEGPNGANGTTTGGTVALIARGAGSNLNLNDDLEATARATGAVNTSRLSVGADAAGGTLSIDVETGGTIFASDSVSLIADAIGANGLINPGNAVGGMVDINIDDGLFSANDLFVSLRGTGTDGQEDFNGTYGDAGNGTGGDLNLTVGTAGTLEVGDIFAEISGFGGQGVDGGTNATEGAGGDGTGGNAVVQLGGAVNELFGFTIQATGRGGEAGTAGDGSDAANGGNGTGGSIDVEVSGSGDLLASSPSMFLYGDAEGGAGGVGGQGDGTTNGGVGGAGGDATGGSVRLAISGGGASAQLGGAMAFLDSGAFAGSGGQGGNNLTGGNAGAGGAGGNGTGGAILIEAESGTTLTLANGLDIGSSGEGGQGGTGGRIDMGSGGFAGTGGVGGVGTGGSPILRAIGGTILGGDVQLTAAGRGGAGGTGGSDGLSVLGTDGDGGAGVGGTPLIEVLEGSPGIITLGAVVIDANGIGGGGTIMGATGGGQITITDASTDPAGLITMSSLTATATGSPTAGTPSLTFESGSGPITVTGNVNADVAGDIVFDFDGSGQLVVGGFASFNANGNIVATHTNNSASTLSIDATGGIFAQAIGNFTSTDNAIISSDADLTVNAFGNITAHDLRGVGDVDISAGQNVTLTNATLGGAPNVFISGSFAQVQSNLRIQAGLTTGGSIDEFDPNFNVLINGDVRSTGNIEINAGGTATFASGSSTISNNGLTVLTGDDIIVAAGSRLEAGASPDIPVNSSSLINDPRNLNLGAGVLQQNGQLTAAILTPIASIIGAGDIVSNASAVSLRANAVDGLGGTISGSSVAIDINDAPAVGASQSDDNGLLSANCLEGTVCLGAITSDNIVSVGQNSFQDVISLTVEQATVSAADVLITIRDDIVMGTNGIPTEISAANQVLLTSLTGDIDLRGANITSADIRIDAAGSLLGDGSLTSVNNIRIDVGQDLNAMLIDTGGLLTNVTPGFRFMVPGAINIGTYNQGVDGTVRFNAGTDLSVGAINIDGAGTRDILLIASDIGDGDVFLGSASGVRSIVLNGDNIGFGNLTANGVITLDTAGTVTGGNLTSASTMTLSGTSIDVDDISTGFITNITATAGDIQTGGITSTSSVRMNATGNITTLDIAADRGASVNADGNINVGTVTSTGNVADIRLNATGTLDFVDIDGSRLVNLDGTVINGGDVLANAGIDIDGTSIVVGDVTSTGGFVVIDSTVGGVTTGNLTSGTLGVQVTSAANLMVGDLNGRGITVDADGDADVGDVNSGTNVAINVDGNLVTGALVALSTSPGMTIRVGGDADIASANSNGLLTLVTTGALTGGGFTAAGLNRLTAGAIDIDSAASTNQTVTIVTNVGDAVIGSTNSNVATTVTAAGAVDIGDATSGSLVTLRGTSVALDSGDVAGNLTLDATAGDVTGTGTIIVGGAVNLDADAGNIAVGSLDAQGGNFTADASGTIGFTAASASGNVLINTTDAINGGDVNAGGTASLDGGNIALGDVSADDIDLTSGTNILFNSLTSPNAISVTALTGTIGANTGSGDIDSGGDVSLTARVINLGDVLSDGSVGADATAGDAAFGTVDAADDITITATGTPSVVNAISGGDTSITGASVTFNNGTIGGNLTLDATTGDIDGNGAVTVGGAIDFDANGNVGFGDLEAQGGNFTVDAGNAITFTGATSSADVIFDAVGAINGGDITATGTAQLDGGNIALGNVDAANIDLTSDANILFNSLMSPNAINVTALNGLIGANTGSGDIDSDDAITLTAQSIDVGDLTSDGSIVANATAGNAGFGAVDAADDIVITAIGTPTVVSVVSGGSTTITGASVILGSGSVGQDLILTATDGDIDATRDGLTAASLDPLLGGGSAIRNYLVSVSGIGVILPMGDNITVGGVIALDASDNVRFENLDAQGGNFSVTAGGNVLFESATSAGTVSMDAGGNIFGRGNLLAGPLVTSFGNIDATNDIILSAANIDLATLAAGGAVSVSATSGNIVLMDIDAVGLIDLDATGFIVADHAETDDDFVATAIGDFTTGLDTIITGGDIVINADIVNLGNSMAGGLIDVTGSQIDFNTITAGSTIDLETIDLNALGIPSNGNGNITGVDMTAGPGASSAIALNSINITGAITIGGSLSMDAGANMLLGAIVTQTGGVSADANGTITYGSIDSAADISLFAGGLISGGDLDAVTGLTLDGGDIAIGDATANTIDITTGADILFDSLDAPNAITLSALNGMIGANTGNGDIDSDDNVALTAQTIAIGNIASGGAVDADATAGDASFGTISSAGNTRITAAGSLTADSITASNAGAGINLFASGAASDINASTLTTNGGDILISSGRDIGLGAAATGAGTPTAGSIGLLAAGDITASGLLAAGEDVAIRSLGAVTLADAQAGDDVSVDADGAITLNSATTSGAGIDLFSLAFNEANAGLAGSIAFAAESPALTGSNIQLLGDGDLIATGPLDARDDIIVSVAGTPSLVNAISGGDTSITGTSVTLNNGAVGGDLTLDATNGDIDGSGTVTVGGAIDFDATGTVGFGSLDAQGGNFTVDAGGPITFTSATSSADIVFDTPGAINGGDVTAVGAANLTGGALVLGDVNAATIGLTSGADILFNSLTSPNAISVTAASGTIGANTGNGDIDSGGDVDLTAQGIAVGNISSDGSISADATAGDASFGAVDAANDIDITASGTPTFTSVTSGGDTTVTGSSIAFSNGNVGGNLSLTSTLGDLSGTGTTTAGGDITLNSAGAISFADIAAPGGGFFATADGDVTVGAVSASTGISIDSINGGDIAATSLTSDQDITIDTAGAFAAQDVLGSDMGSLITIDADGGISIGILTGQVADLQSAAGAIVVNGDITMTGLLDANGQSVLLRSSGSLSVNAAASAGDIDARAAGDLDVQSASAVGDIALTSAGGTATLGNVTATLNGNQGGNITVTSGDGILANGIVNADSGLTFDTVGILDIQGTSSGETITATSTNLDIGSAGALGRSDLTTSIDIMTSEDVIVGGAGTGGRYIIDNDEFSRIHSGGDVTITTTIDGSLTVDDLDVVVAAGTGTPTDGNIGQAGTLSLIGGENIDVIGNATMSNATADNVFAIQAGADLSIDPDDGNLRVEDSNAAITGAINLTAESIIAASAGALNDVGSGTVADADTRLGQNDGATRDDGYIQAGTVTFTIDDALLIQNSGAGTELDDRRGVVADNVTINSSAPDAVIIFNGLVGGNAGIDAIAVTSVPNSFDQASTINGCLIIDPASCIVVVTPNANPSGTDPIQDLIDEQIEDSIPLEGQVDTILVDFKDDPERALDPLIDEPVTGAGNEDLWVSDEEGAEGNCDDPEGFCPAEGELEPAE